jgi:hypothetical protein
MKMHRIAADVEADVQLILALPPGFLKKIHSEYG